MLTGFDDRERRRFEAESRAMEQMRETPEFRQAVSDNERALADADRKIAVQAQMRRNQGLKDRMKDAARRAERR